MTRYQLYMRLKHCVVARHYRGHGIHSPYLYDFIRNVLMKSDLCTLTVNLSRHYSVSSVVEVRRVAEVDLSAYIVVICEPFVSRGDLAEWERWRGEHECLSVWLKGCIVVFFDKRLNNQHFIIRS